MNTYSEEREKEERERRHWVHLDEGHILLVEANSYMDVVRFQDMLDDGMTIDEAEKESNAKVVN